MSEAYVHGYHPRENERLHDQADFPMETQYTYRPTPEESAAIMD
jgi:hypothetical protein